MNNNSDNSSDSDDPSLSIDKLPEPFLELNEEVSPFQQRYSTYATFPLDSAWPTKLAKSGLSATGRGDQVDCSSCDFTKSEWKEEDVPFEAHARSNPECDFVNLYSRTEDDNSSSIASLSSQTELKQTFSNMNDTVEDSIELQLSFQGKVNLPKDESSKLSRVNQGSIGNTPNFPDSTKRDETKLIGITKCNKCWDADSCILFRPCCHFICCQECAEQLEKCFKCHAEVTQKVLVKRA